MPTSPHTLARRCATLCSEPNADEREPMGVRSPLADRSEAPRIPRQRSASGAGIFVWGVIAGLSLWASVATVLLSLR